MRQSMGAFCAAIAFLSAAITSPTHASIDASGDVNPAYDNTDPWNSAATQYVGFLNPASLTISGGSTVNQTGSSSNLTVGSGSQASGSALVVDGAGSAVNTQGHLFVAANGAVASVSISGGGTVTTLQTYIGSNTNLSGGSGKVTVDGAGTRLTASEISVGYSLLRQGTVSGALEITNGGTVAAGSSYVGMGLFPSSGGSAIGAVTVDGAESTWSNIDEVDVGNSYGTGTVNITNGGTASAFKWFVGTGSSNGTVTVGGGIGTSTLTSSQEIYVGDVNPNIAIINILQGGFVHALVINSLDNGFPPQPAKHGHLNFDGGTVQTGVDYIGTTLLSGGGTFMGGSTWLSPIDGNGSLTKIGSGQLNLMGADTYAGATTVNAGTLSISGSHLGGDAYNINSGGILAGIGSTTSIININAGGTLAPGGGLAGSGVGTLGVGTVALLDASSVFNPRIDLGSTLASDLLNVTGGVSLRNSTLILSLLNVPTSHGFPLTLELIANDGTDPKTGLFGTIIVPDGFAATVDYAFAGTDALGRVGSGNDIAVTINAVPEPSALCLASLATLGLFIARRPGNVADK